VRAGLALSLCAATAAVATARPAARAKPRATGKLSSRFSTPADATETPAYRYGQMSQDDCEAALHDRGISYQRETARGVAMPIRLTGPLHGVVFRTNDGDPRTSPYDIVDCRLALALDDFAVILAGHDIVEVRHYSIYRAPPRDWPDDKLGTRHNGALAIDAALFTGRDGKKLEVLKDFHGKIDAKTCGPGAGPHPATPEAVELRAILCEAVDHHLFNVVLTPNYNKPHRNHFHLEITAGVKWFLVH